MNKTISVIGLGYIGLPTAATLAASGLRVIGVDINQHTVDSINAGKIPISEPDLEKMVKRAVRSGNLTAVKRTEAADVFLITVPTPFKENWQPDLSYVEAAINAIAPVLQKGNLVILESTCPVGTTQWLSDQLAGLRKDLHFPHKNTKAVDIHIAYCPERVIPGQILRELIENDRIIGGLSAACARKAKEFYQYFVHGACLLTDAKTAEMAKLTENSFRDVNIAFANEISMICEQWNIDVWELIALANHHPRVNILKPGPGVGGHCIAVDPWFIVSAAGSQAKLIRTAREVNDSKPQFVVDKIISAIKSISHPRIACLGVTYKANTDDLRGSPSICIMQKLSLALDVKMIVVEPNISLLPKELDSRKFQLASLASAIKNADIIVLLVGHSQFMHLNAENLRDKCFINFVNGNQDSHNGRDMQERLDTNNQDKYAAMVDN